MISFESSFMVTTMAQSPALYLSHILSSKSILNANFVVHGSSFGTIGTQEHIRAALTSLCIPVAYQ